MGIPFLPLACSLAWPSFWIIYMVHLRPLSVCIFRTDYHNRKAGPDKVFEIDFVFAGHPLCPLQYCLHWPRGQDVERILICQSRTFYDLLWVAIGGWITVVHLSDGHPRTTVFVVERQWCWLACKVDDPFLAQVHWEEYWNPIYVGAFERKRVQLGRGGSDTPAAVHNHSEVNAFAHFPHNPFREFRISRRGRGRR